MIFGRWIVQHIVSLSGGVSSAVAADRVINRYGRENVTLWFADTSWEDEDLHRFMADCMVRWGGEMVTYRDGRTPLQVASDVSIIPNQKIAPCTRILKIEPFRKWLAKQEKPVTVHLGLNWDEQHRMARPKAAYEELEGVTVDFPLMWEPYAWDVLQEVREWGIDIPRLYKAGFPHNNCGGRCVKQGIAEWNRLRVVFPERFAEVRDWEQAQRAIGDARANYAICRDQSGGTVKPLTLLEIEQRDQPADEQAGQGDMFACFCSY
jgi:3'-phosphoadenosine 5'-phosphosulfate sulfotransferase (PAPS reductase)/FAD synthetase